MRFVLSLLLLCSLLTTLEHSTNSLTRRTFRIGGLKDGHSLRLSCVLNGTPLACLLHPSQTLWRMQTLFTM